MVRAGGPEFDYVGFFKSNDPENQKQESFQRGFASLFNMIVNDPFPAPSPDSMTAWEYSEEWYMCESERIQRSMGPYFDECEISEKRGLAVFDKYDELHQELWALYESAKDRGLEVRWQILDDCVFSSEHWFGTYNGHAKRRENAAFEGIFFEDLVERAQRETTKRRGRVSFQACTKKTHVRSTNRKPRRELREECVDF